MIMSTARILFLSASLLSATGGAMHAAAFRRTLVAIAASNLPQFFGNSLKALWLADSATLFILGAIFSLLAARPTLASRSTVVMIALIPASTASFIYAF